MSLFQYIKNMRFFFPNNTIIPTFRNDSEENLSNENNNEYLDPQNIDVFNEYSYFFASKDYDHFFSDSEINEENYKQPDTLPQISISDKKIKFELNECIISNKNSFMYTPQKNINENINSLEKVGTLGIKRKRSKHHKQQSKNTNTGVHDGNLKENKIKKDILLKEKGDNGIIKNNPNIDNFDSLTEIFNILPKLETLFKSDDKYNNFIKFSKEKKWEDFIENKSSIIEIDETKEENIGDYKILKETLYQTFDNILQTEYNKKSEDEKNIDYESIIKKLIKLIRIITKPPKRKKGKEKKGKNDKNESYNGGYFGINNENLIELIDQNNFLILQNNGKNQLSEINHDCMTSTKENSDSSQNLEDIDIMERKDNLFYVFKTWVLSSFIKDFNKINKIYQIKKIEENKENKGKKINEVNIDTTKNLKIKDEIEFLTKSFEDFVNKGCTKIYLVDPKNIKGKEESDDAAENLMKFTKIDYMQKKLDIEKFLKNDEFNKTSRYQNDKCRNILKELYQNKDLKGLIILNKFLKLDNNGHIRIKKKDEFKKAIEDLYGKNKFVIDLTEEEKLDIEYRKKIFKKIFKYPLSFLDGRKRGRKRGRKIGRKKGFKQVAKKNK